MNDRLFAVARALFLVPAPLHPLGLRLFREAYDSGRLRPRKSRRQAIAEMDRFHSPWDRLNAQRARSIARLRQMCVTLGDGPNHGLR